jgi:hypothetical protein
MPENLTQYELKLARGALSSHIGEYNHEDKHLEHLEAVYAKLTRMELAFDGYNVIAKVGGVNIVERVK